MQNVLPTAADVADAHLRIRDWIFETPVLESDPLSRRIGARVLLKAECLQRGGSFKIRGALNRILQLSVDERGAGVVAFSSGNHAQAVAIAARWLGCRATIVMPRDAPRAKLDGTRSYGAEIVLYDRERDDREAIAARLAAERGAALVPPFDHAHVIAGQGTAALELGRALAARDQVRLFGLRRLCRRAGRVHEARGLAARRRTARPERASADALRRPACPRGRRDHVRDQSTRARGRGRGRRRHRARGDGARGRAPQGRLGAVGGRGARRSAA